MTNKIQIREIGAWMVLVIAIVLLSVSIAVSQTKVINVENENGKTQIKISKTENGITTKYDTTFDANDDTDIDKIIEQFGKSHGEKIVVNKNIHEEDSKKPNKIQKVLIDLDLPELSDAERARFNNDMKKSMKAMKKGIHDMQESMKNMHIHIDNDSDVDIKEIEEMDNFTDKDHFVISGESNEIPPVLEKVVTTKDGKKIFIYKRSNVEKSSAPNVKKSDQEFQLSGIENIKYYPNPTEGKLMVSFNSTDKNSISNMGNPLLRQLSMLPPFTEFLKRLYL